MHLQTSNRDIHSQWHHKDPCVENMDSITAFRVKGQNKEKHKSPILTQIFKSEAHRQAQSQHVPAFDLLNNKQLFPECHRNHIESFKFHNQYKTSGSCSNRLFLSQWNNTEHTHIAEWCCQPVSDQGNELWLLHDMKQHSLWKGHLLRFRYRFVSGLINPKEQEALPTSREWVRPELCVCVCVCS